VHLSVLRRNLKLRREHSQTDIIAVCVCVCGEGVGDKRVSFVQTVTLLDQAINVVASAHQLIPQTASN
jgi:hypothetical protein